MSDQDNRNPLRYLARQAWLFTTRGPEHVGCQQAHHPEDEGYDESMTCCGSCGCCPCWSWRCGWCRGEKWPFKWLTYIGWKGSWAEERKRKAEQDEMRRMMQELKNDPKRAAEIRELARESVKDGLL